MIALYNTEKKELIGVFKTYAMASRYIFTKEGNWTFQRIWNAMALKVKLRKDIIFDFPVAVRTANDRCKALLGENDVYITPNYPEMSDKKINGMTSCRWKMK